MRTIITEKKTVVAKRRINVEIRLPRKVMTITMKPVMTIVRTLRAMAMACDDSCNDEDTEIKNKEEQVEKKYEDSAKSDEEIKEEMKAVGNDEELVKGTKERKVLDVNKENKIVHNKEEQKKTKKGKRKNIFLSWLCGKIVKVFVKRNVLL